MPNLHLDNNMKLLKNHLFSEYEKLLSQDITWDFKAFDLLFEGICQYSLLTIENMYHNIKKHLYACYLSYV